MSKKAKKQTKTTGATATAVQVRPYDELYQSFWKVSKVGVGQVTLSWRELRQLIVAAHSTALKLQEPNTPYLYAHRSAGRDVTKLTAKLDNLLSLTDKKATFTIGSTIPTV